MKKLPLYIIIFLSIIILILFYNLFVSENGYKERTNLIIENQELTNRNDSIKDANEELIFEIVNAQDNEEHIENYARENLNLSMPDEEFIKFNNTDLENQND